MLILALSRNQIILRLDIPVCIASNVHVLKKSVKKLTTLNSERQAFGARGAGSSRRSYAKSAEDIDMRACVCVCVCDYECDSICSCDSAAKSRITHTEDFTVKLPYFIYDFYDFFLYFSTHSSTFQWKFSQDTYELSTISGWCLGKIGFNIPDALGEVFPGQSALVAVHVKFAGTLLHGMDADAYGDL